MAKKAIPFGGKMAKPFGGKETAKEEKMEAKKMKGKKTMKAYGGGMMTPGGGGGGQKKQAMRPAPVVKPAKGRA